MSALERRLQILLDRERYALVESEASRTGRSVAAVIREAIDLRFSTDIALRAKAAAAFLDATADPGGPGEDWAEAKAAMEDDLARRLP
ncbi:MAG: antitoxin [Actinomycetota bacterium]